MKITHLLCMAVCPVIIVILAAKPAKVNKNYLSLQTAEESGEIHLKITSNGKGHSGSCINMEIANTQDDSGYYRLEAGRRLNADDSTAQDILVTKEQDIRLAAHEKKDFSVYGFCCQAHHHGPYDKSKYKVGKMANNDLATLAQYLNQHHFSESAAQYAIWVISDNHLLSSVIGDNADSVNELRRIVAGIKHIEVPWYSLSYETDTATLFSGKHTRINGTLKYYVPNNTIVNISVYDSYGLLVKTLSNGPANPDRYTYQLALDVRGWLKGKYYIRVTQDDNKTLEQTFEL